MANRSSHLRGWIWSSPFLIGLALFTLLPAALSIAYSFTDYSLLDPPVFVGLDNYREMLADPALARATLNTFLFCLLNVSLGTILSVAIALLLEQRLPFSALARLVVFLPTLVPVVAGSLGWMWVLNADQGVLNRSLAFLHLPTPNWLGDARFALPAIVLVSLWSIGSAVVIAGASLRDVPPALYEAALLDGAGPVRRLRHVTLPMITPALTLNIIMSLIWSTQAFAAPLIMTRGGPQNATLTYAMHVYNNAFVFGRMGYACALAWVQFIATALLVALALKILSSFSHTRPAR
jgi:multiple sugar transport system permease protein